MISYNANDLQFRYPDNWKQYGQGSAITFAPDSGIVNGALAYGMMVAEFEPDYHGQGRISLEVGSRFAGRLTSIVDQDQRETAIRKTRDAHELRAREGRRR